jgi:hypothetical protein
MWICLRQQFSNTETNNQLLPCSPRVNEAENIGPNFEKPRPPELDSFKIPLHFPATINF